MEKTQANATVLERLQAEFETLKKSMVSRVASKAGDDTVNAFISLVSEYQENLLTYIDEYGKKMQAVQEENDILRSISGVSESDIKLKLLSLGEEISFLRKKIIDLKKEIDAARKENEALSLDIYQLKETHAKLLKAKADDQNAFQKKVDDLRAEITAYERKMQSKNSDLDAQKAKLEELYKHESVVMKKVAQRELAAVADRLRDLCGVVASSAQFCLERWADKSAKLGKESGKKSALQIFVPQKNKHLAEISSDLGLIHQFSQEAISTLDAYADMLAIPPVVTGKIYWQGFWEKLKRKYFDVTIKNRIKITWPAEKKYPVVLSDEAKIQEICELILQNAVEVLPSDGELKVSGQFDEKKTVLFFSDNGPGVKEENKEKIFLPFFTTKPSHKGVGLPRALKVAEALTATLAYERKDGMTVFRLEIPHGAEEGIGK